MHRTTRAVLAMVSLSIGLSYLSQRPAGAYKRYMIKEGLTTCAYCHIKESGGGPRNYRGQFYQMHDHTFAGFDDAAEAKTAGVDVGPDAAEKPSSLTPPAPSAPVATPTPTPAPAAPVKAPAAKSALTAAMDKAHNAKLAYQKNPKSAALKSSYIAALAQFSHATLVDTTTPAPTKYINTQALAKQVLALDPKNASAKSDLATATAALKKK